MGVQLDFISKLKLFICPFENTCNLPKKQFLCKIPECKNCTNYFEKVKKTQVTDSLLAISDFLSFLIGSSIINQNLS